ncbi:MAG: TlpA family protein disulfide reductase [Bacteroidales bacterium]|jgi:thiol-disulfide isomerase/thioredoxin|nr:TlpA family protein disulfide reductase [Bacteroidales bacterium]
MINHFFVFLFLLLSFPVFSQVTRTPDGKGLTLTAKVFLHYDPQGSELTEEQFGDSIATQEYISGADFRNDTIKLSLISKMPRGIAGKKLPEAEWETINGNRVKYGDSGKITLLSFWSVICKPCIEELNELNEWVKAHSDVRIIAVTADSASTVSAFMKRNSLSWPNIAVVPEYKGNFDDMFRIYVWPLNVVTDNRRVVRKVFTGKKDELTDYLCSLL